jgi:hypothetical protein
MVTGESDEWPEDDDGALHALPAAEHYAILSYGSRQGCYTINIVKITLS